MYVQDYDENHPMSFYLVAPNRLFLFYDAIYPYQKNSQILQCPSDAQRNDLQTFFSGFGLQGMGNFRYTSYMGNFAVFENGFVPGLSAAVPPVTLAEIPWHVQTTVMYDGWLTPTFNSPVSNVHNDGVNSSFVDGHAKWVKVIQNAQGNWQVANLEGYTNRLELWGVPCNGNPCFLGGTHANWDRHALPGR
jgi:prepilin-type processing-associated H-X9-DG protein